MTKLSFINYQDNEKSFVFLSGILIFKLMLPLAF